MPLDNQAREKAEKTVDELCKAAGQKKPRMCRRHARKDDLRLSKARKRSGKAIRSAVRKQLQYIRRDMGYIAELIQKGAKLHISLVDGYARIERLDFEPFNESEALRRAAARYRDRYGCYP